MVDVSAVVVECGAVAVDDFVDVLDVVGAVVEGVVGAVLVGMVIVGIVGGIVTIVNVVDDVVDDVVGSVLIVVVVGSVGSQSRVIGQRDGRDCATDENTSEAAP